ncbi:F-box/LRR-repeat protein At5g63520-like [Prosopis cineraria]|uniref:F-box/LRR-repeat protein At5g63520-like n=1 Tax=Prosopis cineraria TaxID=364024 RepID=UPI0024106F63|nr:F-box/LRR-repeat protein At5g63520-like [Prosopis cineraria]
MESRGTTAPINGCKDDILHNILGRLPASTFANAACVSKTWYRICSQILSRPMLASALSLNPSLLGAVEEVIEKVLSKPIRPHFAIACISEQFGLRGAHLLLSQRLGTKTPLVTHIGSGVMGMEALTNQLREVKWDYFDYQGPHPREANGFSDFNRGIVLVVGYVPGLKVDAIPLIHPKNNPVINMVDEFVRSIKTYTCSVSGHRSPAAVIIFGDRRSDMNDIVATMDHAMGKETVMVGDSGGCFLFTSGNYTISLPPDLYVLDAVALVFARDKHKSPDVGETRFHVAMAGGLVPFGPRFEVIDVIVKGDVRWTCLSALVEGFDMILNFEAVIETLLETVSDRRPDLYIGVSHRRRYYTSNGRLMNPDRIAACTSFHQVLGGEGEYFVVDGVGVRPGDKFLFYHRDLETARATSEDVFDNLRRMKQSLMESEEEAVFGGLVFVCASRGQSYFGRPHVDIYPFCGNFPRVPFAGIFCKGEIGRISSSSSSSSSLGRDQEWQEQAPPHCSVHASSAVYLAMSYLPPPHTQLTHNTTPLRNNPVINMVDEFVRSIKTYTCSVSGHRSPAAVIIFGDRRSDMNDIVATMGESSSPACLGESDHAMGKETVMVGDSGGCFLFTSGNYTISLPPDLYVLDAVALVFARDKHKSPDVGDTRFHVAMAGGLVPFGPRFEVIDVIVKGDVRWTCLSALVEGFDMILNFEAVIETLLETVSDRRPDLYIGVSHRRRYYTSNGRLMNPDRIAACTSFHQVLGGEGEYFVVDGVGVRPGDKFLFYHRDLETARATSEDVFDNLRRMKQSLMESEEEAVFGGLVFVCASRGQSYFGRPHVDIYPFCGNFPRVPFAGIFCKGEIGRISSSSSSSSSLGRDQEWQEQAPPHCSVHASSAVYLAMSYLPPPHTQLTHNTTP